MRQKAKQDRCCTYVISLRDAGDLPSLSDYLSFLGVHKCEVIVLDSSARDLFDENRRVLRWVSRHIAVPPTFDLVRTAAEIASCEKIIIAGDEVRYDAASIDDICLLLEVHEVVEPQEYLDPLPWWGGIEAGRMLVHRGIEPLPDHGETFGFRRSALRALRGFDATRSADPARRLAAFGAEVFSAIEVFVRRRPPQLAEWFRERPRAASDDFAMPAKTAFFFALIPMAMALALIGGVRVAGGYAGAVAFGSMVLAVRGRIGASAFFPLRACLFAPLWVLERSVSVYWALLSKIRGAWYVAPLPARGERVAEGRVRGSIAAT